MSSTNGTALGSSTNTPDKSVMPGPQSGLAKWIDGIDDPAPLDVVDRDDSRTAAVGDRKAPRLTEADQLEHELAEAKRLVAIQSNPLLLARMAPEERAAERRAARRVRAAYLREERAAQLAEVRRRRKARRVDTEMRDQEAADERWHRRAESARGRLTSPAARLAALYRSYRRQIRGLIAVACVGVAWGAVNVQGIIAAQFGLKMVQPGYWLAFGLEPLVTIPLIVLMAYQATLADWGRETTWRQQLPVRAVEVVLLGAAIAMNALPHAGEAASSAWLYVVPPSMIAVSMLVLPIVSAKIGRILLDARDDAEEAAALGIEGSALARFTDRLFSTFSAAKSGEIGGERDEHGLPSVSAIRNYQGCAKTTAQTVKKIMVAARM